MAAPGLQGDMQRCFLVHLWEGWLRLTARMRQAGSSCGWHLRGKAAMRMEGQFGSSLIQFLWGTSIDPGFLFCTVIHT